MFGKVLVANRGEIAIRVFRTLREMGIASVAVYSEVDRDALFVRHGRRGPPARPGPGVRELPQRRRGILEVVARSRAPRRSTRATASWPRTPPSRAPLGEAGVTWIGPPPDAIDAMGSKTGARALMDAAGVPIVPGVTEPVPDLDAARPIAEEIGYPVAVKAAAGGGGKGFRVALRARRARGRLRGRPPRGRALLRRRHRLPRALPARAAPRRDPDPGRRPRQRACAWASATARCSAATRSSSRRRRARSSRTTCAGAWARPRSRAARAVGYTGAGTLEYLVAGEEFFFLEMNTRIQVEHTVTEAVTGLDLVREQVPRRRRRAALGRARRTSRPAATPSSAASTPRTPRPAFAPSPARITAYREPAGPGVRVDSGVRAGSDIPDIYDPMVAKLIVWDVDRESARRRMLRALDEYVVEGPATLIPFHRWLLGQEEFIAGGACHALLAELAESRRPIPGPPTARAGAARRRGARGGARRPSGASPPRSRAAASRWRLRYSAADGGGGGGAPGARAEGEAQRERRRRRRGGASAEVVTPMQGTVLKVLVEAGQAVEAGRRRLHRRGDEDGERGGLAASRDDSRDPRLGGRFGQRGRGPRGPRLKAPFRRGFAGR